MTLRDMLIARIEEAVALGSFDMVEDGGQPAGIDLRLLSDEALLDLYTVSVFPG